MNFTSIIALIIAVLGGMAIFRFGLGGGLDKLKSTVKYVCSAEYDPAGPERKRMTAVLGLSLTVVFTVIMILTGYRFQGIFGIIQDLIIWSIVICTIVYIALSAKNGMRYLHSIPREKRLPVLLLLPAGMLVGYLTGKLIVYPLINLILRMEGDNTRLASEGAAALSGLYVWFFTAKSADEFRKWPKKLAIFAAGGAAGALVPWAIALAILAAIAPVVYKMAVGVSLGKYATNKEADAILGTPKNEQEANEQFNAQMKWLERSARDQRVSQEEQFFEDLMNDKKD